MDFRTLTVTSLVLGTLLLSAGGYFFAHCTPFQRLPSMEIREGVCMSQDQLGLLVVLSSMPFLVSGAVFAKRVYASGGFRKPSGLRLSNPLGG